MTFRKLVPYGSWASPITADLIVASTIGLVGTALDEDWLYWQELRPQEGGRNVILRRDPEGQVTEMTPAPFNVRNRVHEYGGGSFTVAEGVIYFSNFADQRLYAQRSSPGDSAVPTPIPITPEAPLRYADGRIDRLRQRWIGVREDHRLTGEPQNTIVAVPLEGDQSEGFVLVSGQDFYAAPRLSPDGSQCAWLSWDHPQMPWDGTTLWVAPVLSDGSLGQAQRVAGGVDESIVQPEWSPDGVLHFVSDRSNWWNLYRWHGGKVEALCPKAAEFGLPQWIFGLSSYGFMSPTEILCIWTEQGQSVLGYLNTDSQDDRFGLTPLDLPYRELGGVAVNPDRAVFIGAAPDRLSELVAIPIPKQFPSGDIVPSVLKKSSEIAIDPAYFSIPEALTFPTENGEVAYGIYYPPCNPDYQAPAAERPPLLVKSHGGPTSATRSALNLSIQYWTSRGFAILDVNYRGSTGYGRTYREKLKGKWGIADVADCAYGAKFLAERGDVDGDRLTIDGGSAGGYTTLCALTFTNVFKAGASRYGVSDLAALTEDTHKFESRYLDSLVGLYPAQKAIYEERSPIHHTDKLNCPVIFFQGLDDRIVPPNQAEMMVDALKEKGIPVAYVPFPGEQHGFRKAENIKRSLDVELYFYAKIFGFELAETIEPIEIFNLED